MEYVGFSYPEKIYSQKNLLQAQMELLDGIKKFREYKKLREEELVLKVALKTKIDGIFSGLKKLDKILPRSSYGAGIVVGGSAVAEKKELSLEDEIEQIRRKLEGLRGD